MIVPMIKYGFLVYHRDFDSFLIKLQELGMVDIIQQTHTPTEKERNMLGLVNRYTSSINSLRFRFDNQSAASETNLEDILKEYEDLQVEHEQNEVLIRKAQKDIADARPWGEFNPNTIKAISEKGINIRFLITPEKVFSNEWALENPVEVINRQGGLVYFVALQKDVDFEIPFEVQEVRLPSFSFKQKEDEIEGFKKRLHEIELRFDEIAQYIPSMEKAKTDLMNSLEYIAVQSSADKQAEDTLMILQGWIPIPKNEDLLKFLDNEGIAYVSEKGQLHEDAPILLKNNKFARLFEPVGGFFTSPTYSELDLTPFFAPFFMMFFGFCLGDAGYGLIFLIGATTYKIKGNKKMRPLMSLVQLLGLSTVIFGVLTGTIFGVDMVKADIAIDRKSTRLNSSHT